MSSIEEYVNSRRRETFEELKELLRIPSISTSAAHRKDIERCAELVERRAREAGLEARILPTQGHPAVYAERLAGPAKPTILVYGHYDVQPPDSEDLWKHGPFEPTLEGDLIYARGSSDDKGQFYSLLKGIEVYLKTREESGVNIKVLIEGEEEIGSPSLPGLIRKEKERLECDLVVIADSSQFAWDVPAITYGLRGLVYLELIVRGPVKDLHSGSYGGAVANPANILARMIAACQGPFGKVAIPGFYDDVRDLEPWEREEFARLPFDEKGFREELGVPRLFGEEGYTTLERKWARPTFDVHGLLSGFTEEGSKTVLPRAAQAKFSMRLVPDQDPEKIASLARDFLLSIAPDTVKVEIIDHHGCKPVLVPRDVRGVEEAVRAFARAYGREPVFIREGGSIPVVITFREELGAHSLVLGLGLPDDDAHGPNEKFRLEDYYRGMVTLAALLEELER